jgi:hypothetical protein
MSDLLPPAVKNNLERHCSAMVKKVSRIAPGEKNEKKLASLLNNQVCKEVRKIDQHLLKQLAVELRKVGKKHNPKQRLGIVPDVKAAAKPKEFGAGVPSLTIPITKFLIDERLGTTGKLELKVWADPRDLQTKEKGLLLNFTVVKW